MKVILLKDVPKIGRKYETKNVSDGHATNFLIPKGLAEVATGGALKRVENLKVQEGEEKKVKEDLLMKNLDDISGVTVEMIEKANEQGHLFAGIHSDEIIPALKEQTHLEVLPEHIILDKPIKTVGEHDIQVKIQNKEASFKLIVKAK
jgi:large subunit ribosomal protein L9